MKKITELTEIKKRTVYHRDAYGNRLRDVEEFVALRPVKCVEGGQRFVGLMIDVIFFNVLQNLVVLIYYIITGNIEKMEIINPANLGVSYTLIFIAYQFTLEYNFQKTIGKYFLKLRVIDELANKPTLKTNILRSIIRIIPIDALSFLWAKQGRGWHDQWSKTWVVSEEELKIIKQLQQEQLSSH